MTALSRGNHRLVLVLELIVLSILFIAWLVTLFLVVVDPIPLGRKVLWAIAVIVLAPVAIPVYLVMPAPGRDARPPDPQRLEERWRQHLTRSS